MCVWACAPLYLCTCTNVWPGTYHHLTSCSTAPVRRHNFRMRTNVSFPTPLYPLVAPDVLVESFEEGELISTFVKKWVVGGRERERERLAACTCA